MNLNLGCADRLLPGTDWINVDVSVPAGVSLAGNSTDFPDAKRWVLKDDEQDANPYIMQFWDLNELPWPWPTSSVSLIQAHDVLEHLSGRINSMNELHRVLGPGGRVEIVVPNAYHGAGFYQDPTHVSPWCRNSFQYFIAGSFAQQRLAKQYGITAAFKVVGEIQDIEYAPDPYEPVWKIHATLEAVK